MSAGFAAEWLALRAPADARARDAAGLVPDLAAAVVRRAGEGTRILDLGAGAGNNLHYLAERLDSAQRWVLVDSDAALLATVRVRPRARSLVAAPLVADLAAGVPVDALRWCDLVTASALFDLVSAAWLDRFAAACARARTPVGLFALTVDGRLDWTPAEPEDAEMAALLAQHMRGDKGFGPALGPDAPAALTAAFARHGYRVRTADSAWTLDAATDAPLMRALIAGYEHAAAAAAAPDRAAAVADWAARRRAHVEAGRGGLVVGHRDHLVTRASR